MIYNLPKKKYFCLYLIRWVHALTRSHLHWQKKFFQLILWLFLLPFNKFIYFSHASSVFEVAQRQKRNIRTETNIRKFRWTFFFFYPVATGSGKLFAVIMSKINCLFFVLFVRLIFGFVEQEDRHLTVTWKQCSNYRFGIQWSATNKIDS